MDAVQGGAIAEAVNQGIPFFSLNVNRLPASDLSQTTMEQVQGALLFDLLPDSQLLNVAKTLNDKHVPFLAFSAFTLLPDVAYLLPDHRLGMAMLTNELLHRGYRKILFYTADPTTYYWQREQYAGYQQALEEAGVEEYPRPRKCYSMPLNIRDLIVNQTTFENHIRLAAGYLLDCFAPGTDAPEVIVAPTDWTAQIIAAALRLLNRTPGKDIQITGYDNKCDHSPWNDFEEFRPLLTVDRRNALIGKTMVNDLRDATMSRASPVEKRIPPFLLDNCGNRLA